MIYLLIVPYNNAIAEFMYLQLLFKVIFGNLHHGKNTCSACAGSPNDSENDQMISLQRKHGSSRGIHPLKGSFSFVLKCSFIVKS